MESSIMSLPNSTIAAVQKAGAAVYEADAELRAALKGYSEKVVTSVGRDPFNIRNDALFESMKSLARFSQTIAQIEIELQKVHAFVTGLAEEVPKPAVLALAAPVNLAATDVVVKVRKVKAKVEVKPITKTVIKPSLEVKSGPKKLPSNAARLLVQLEKDLSREEFSSISQTSVALATGIPLGSMTASLKRLCEAGAILVGPGGTYKLA